LTALDCGRAASDAAGVPQSTASQAADLPPYARPGWSRPRHLEPAFLGAAPPTDASRHAEPALIRDLPYPFANALTIASDADLSTFRSVVLYRDLIQRGYGLNLGQSFYCLSGGGAPAAPAVSYFSDASDQPMRVDSRTPLGLRTDQLFLRLAEEGAFDFLHSYGDDGVMPLTLCAALAVRADATGGGRGECTPTSEARSPNGAHGIHFLVSAEGHPQAAELALIDETGSEYTAALPAEWLSPGKRRWVQLGFDQPRRVIASRTPLSFEPWGASERRLARVRLRIWGDPGSRLVLERLGFTFLSRDLVERQISVLHRLGIGASADVRHGGFTGQTGHSWITGGVRETEASYPYSATGKTLPAMQRWSADDARTPFYHTDLLSSRLGVDFFDTGMRPDPLPIKAMLDAETGQDSRPRYGFHRMSDPTHLRGRELRVEEARVGSVHSVGAVIELGLRRLQEGTGRAVVLYTHYGDFQMPGAPAEPTASYPFHENAGKGFEMLRALHYNVFGDLPLRSRIWVTTVPSLLRYSLARRSVEPHARIDYEGSRVELESFHDPVLGRSLPSTPESWGELHGLTFYVRHAGEARVSLDGRPMGAFKRNPADDSGRESITLVDDSSPLAALDEVDPTLQGRVGVRGGRLVMRQGGLSRGRRRAALFMEGPEAELDFDPGALSSEGSSFFHFEYRKTGDFALQLGWEDARGVRTVAREAGTDASVDQGWTIPRQPPGELGEVVLDYADLERPRAGFIVVPRALVRRLFVRVRGARAGDVLELDRVAFLREDPRPLHLRGATVRLGGRVAGLPNRLVYALVDGEPKEVLTDADGYYALPAVPRGAVVQLWVLKQGRPVYLGGRRALQADDDRADLDL
jgi:hypothetical protein